MQIDRTIKPILPYFWELRASMWVEDVLEPDLTLASNTAICNNGTRTLVSGLNPAIYSFVWTFNGNPIGGNTSDLIANQPGTYGLTYTIIATNCPVTTDFIDVEFYDPITTPDPVDLFQCDASKPIPVSICLSTLQSSMLPNPGLYHSSLADATSNTNPLPSTFNIATARLPIPIWTRILDTATNCFITKTFQLGIVPPPVANIPGDLTLCETVAGAKTANFDLSSQAVAVLGGQSPTLYEVSFYGNLADANAGINRIDPNLPYTSTNATLFARINIITDANCFSTTSFNLIVVPRPTLDQLSNQYVCNSYTLPALVNPGNYYSGPNQGLPMLNVGDVITTDQTIYIYSTTTGTPSCPFESSFNIRIITPLDINANRYQCL